MQEFFSIWLFSAQSIRFQAFIFLPSVPVSWKIGLSYAKEDKRARMEVLQHWNPTNLSGQLLLLIMYAVLMHATFPMLDSWFGACLCRQRFWAVFFQLTGLCSLLQEQLQIPRHMINIKNGDSYLTASLPNIPVYILHSTLCNFLHGRVLAPV